MHGSPLRKRWLAVFAHDSRTFEVVCIAAIIVALFASYVWAQKNVKIEVDGQVVSIATTATTVAGVLEAAGIQLHERDVTLPGLDDTIRDGTVIVVKRAVSLTVAADKKTWKVKTSRETVGDVLRELGLAIGPKDKVSHDLAARVTDGMAIRIIRVTEKRQVKQVKIPFKEEVRKDRNMDRGRTRVLVEGKEGLKEQEILVTYEDGRPVSQKVVSERVVSKPVNRVVAVGVRKPLRTLTTSRGTYRYRDSRLMLATAYEPGPASCGKYADGYTSIGLKAQYGIAAVDPDVIPLRTRLYIEGYGPAIAGDTGSAIQGNRIDLCFNTLEEALRFGRRRVRVYILEP
ncbi:MAG TPA: DUF348 domain-containing protein [Firmicutes bacterium]|nr:DUF348 domain-containing protein [Bacillota bacterium]